MTSPTKFYNFVNELDTKAVNANTGTWKIALFSTAPSQSTTLYSSLTGEVANGNGYTTGGITVTGTGVTNSSGTDTLAGNAVTWTSSTGNLGPFRYIVLYESVSGANCMFWDYGSNLTLNGVNGDTFQVSPTGSVLYTLA